MKRLFYIPVLFIGINLQSQVSISGVVNSYYQVTTLAANSVTCSSTTGLQSGDKVLLIQMTGPSFNTASAGWEKISQGSRQRIAGKAGQYEFLSVNTVVANTVTFTANLKNIYVSTEKIQLVKVYEADKAIINGTLSAVPWNGSTGGIVALVILKRLEFSAAGSINVSSQGFRGAAPTQLSGCRPVYNPYDTFYFSDAKLNRGGRKGEGITSPSFSAVYTKGPGDNWTGGGGAYGYLGGGGGGSSNALGGFGGLQGGGCSNNIQMIAERGYEFNYYNNQLISYFSFGGGGGGATYSASTTSDTGGNGGGMVFILADTIDGNGRSIVADGGGVTTDATGGGAGGGGGGSVVIDASTYIGNLIVYARGGKGGNTITNCGGEGGGGGGGILAVSNSSWPSNVLYNLIGGVKGSTGCSITGSDGNKGDTNKNYKPVLNGFLFNAITGNDTICQGQVPQLIRGTLPKGAGAITYLWLQSNDNNNWSVIAGQTSRNYQPPALNSSLYYTRVVTSAGISDTAFSIRVYVYNSIAGNSITVRDTLCVNATGILNAGTVSGGDFPNYNYLWQSSTDQSAWISAGTEAQSAFGPLTLSTYYRRIVTSANVCKDTSETELKTILPAIANNTFLTPDTTICSGLSGGIIKSHNPTGGDGTYQYSWLSSLDNITYNPVSGATTSTYTPSIASLTVGTHYYKRTVVSGNDNVCIDTSVPARLISVLPSISNNSITADSTRYCAGNTVNTIIGNPAMSGGAGSYTFQWYLYDGATWQSISAATGKDYLPGPLEDTSIFRRQVVSGDDNACVSNSDSLTIRVIPQIQNAIISAGENICEGSVPLSFAEQPATGGANTYTYQWQQKTSATDWTNAANGGAGVSYSPPSLLITTQFRRVVYSQICSNESNFIEVVVYPGINSNSIAGSSIQYNCFNSQMELSGSTPTGGRPGGPFSFFWQESEDDSSWNPVSSGGNSEDFNSQSIQDPVYYRRIVHSGETDQCKDTSESVQILINPLPSGDIFSGIDTLCSGTNIEISYVLSGNGPWTVELGQTGVLHSESNLRNTTGTISFILTNSANIKVLNIEDDSTCLADLTSDTGLVVATVYEMPVSNAGDDFEVCGLEARLAAVPSAGEGLWETSEGEFNNASLANAMVTAADYGLHTLTWTETNWRECVDNDGIDVVFYQLPDSVDAGEDIQLSYEFNTKLNAREPEVGNGLWQFVFGTGELSDPTLYNSDVSFEEIGNYKLLWTVSNGICPSVIDSLSLMINDIIIYGGFSPNGDNINDFLNFDLPQGASATLIIIDRNGNKVIELEANTVISWDGANGKGKQVPDDTYYYILKEESGKIRTGYIELRR